MVKTREEKVKRVANYIPDIAVIGEQSGDLLVVGWGSTYGHLLSVVKKMQNEGHKVGLAQFAYINPLPKNTAEVFSRYKKIIVCELNLGQFVNYLRFSLQQFQYLQYNKIQGLPFTQEELKKEFSNILDTK
jgi:2-oxoglutarate/2-oxoacid ferredoxin oxidoreductase subunit alpha